MREVAVGVADQDSGGSRRLLGGNNDCSVVGIVREAGAGQAALPGPVVSTALMEG